MQQQQMQQYYQQLMQMMLLQGQPGQSAPQMNPAMMNMFGMQTP